MCPICKLINILQSDWRCQHLGIIDENLVCSDQTLLFLVRVWW